MLSAQMVPSSGLTPDARGYAARQLARRAGVSRQTILGWRIETHARETLIYVQPGSAKRISVPVCDVADWGNLDDHARTTRAGWMQAPANNLAQLVPDFILPFASADGRAFRPLFSAVDENEVACSCDVLSSVLLTLCRYEETISSTRDAHGRFPASASLATKQGFLRRPIVDEYGFALQQALSHLLPSWKPDNAQLRVKLSHDADLVGLPFSLRASFGHALKRRKPQATVRDVLSVLSAANPAYLQLVSRVVALAERRGIRSAVYWQAAPASGFDTGYDPRHPKVRRTIDALSAAGVELGVHPGYTTFQAPEQLQREVQTLRAVFGNDVLGGRQHYLRWSPRTWIDWESCGLAYDSTVGYADEIGFRAGTCLPYRPWLLEANREAKLLEIPLIVMDETLVGYMHVKGNQLHSAVDDVIERCRLVGGVFALLWHNSSLLEPAYGDAYEMLLERLAGSTNYDWKEDLT